MYKQVELTRKALYLRVWERTVLVLAKEIGAIQTPGLSQTAKRFRLE